MARKMSAHKKSPTRAAELTQARQDLRACVERLTRCGAAALQAGLLPDDEVLRFRSALKQGATKKLPTVGHIVAAREQLAAMASAYEARLEENGLPIPLATEPSKTLGREAPAEPASNHGEVPMAQRRNALRSAVAKRIARGTKVREVLESVGLPTDAATKRWAQRVAREWDLSSKLHDGRTTVARRMTQKMTPALCALVEALAMQFTKASARGLRLLIKRHVEYVETCLREGTDVSDQFLVNEVAAGTVVLPHERTIRRFIEGLSETKKFVRAHGMAEWVRRHRPVVGVEWARRANEEWQIDHTPLDLWVRIVNEHGVWIAVRVFLTAIIDVYSRAVMAFVLSARDPDAFTTTHALRMAILPKPDARWTARGLPERLVLDNGKDFRAHAVAGIIGSLGIEQIFCTPHNPDEKPHVEAWFGSLKRTLLPTLDGYTHGIDRGETWSEGRVMRLMTLSGAREAIHRWIVEEYHTELHREIDGPPLKRWEENVPDVVVPPARELDELLLHRTTRKISRGVIRFTLRGERRSYYYMPILLEKEGMTVEIRYNPDDLKSVLVYDPRTKKRMGEAWDPYRPESPYTREQIVQAAMKIREKTAKRIDGLRDRLPTYYQNSAETDRVAKRRKSKAWDAAREEAARQLDSGETGSASTATSVNTAGMASNADTTSPASAAARAGSLPAAVIPIPTTLDARRTTAGPRREAAAPRAEVANLKKALTAGMRTRPADDGDVTSASQASVNEPDGAPSTNSISSSGTEATSHLTRVPRTA